MFLKLVIFSLFLTFVGCSNEGFNRNQFNKLEKEFVEKELFAEPSALLVEPSAKETTNDMLFLCRSEIKNNQAIFYVLKTWSFPSNDAWFRQKEILQELETLSLGDKTITNSVDDAYGKVNGVSVSFDQVVIGAKGGSSWSYLKSGGNAYIKYLDENYNLNIENTEKILNGEMQSGFFNINRGLNSDNLMFRFEKESLEIYLAKDGLTEKLDCYVDLPIEPSDVEPNPGLSPSAVSVSIETENNSEIFFTEGIERKYIVNVRLYLPDLEFDAELVDAPDGMELRLLSETKMPGSQKFYELVWKPSFDAIPDESIPSIIRFFNIRVNVGLDNLKLEEFRYILYNDTL